MEVYLHQLSARLLGWRRSCDPPAIVLELPAGNNQSHCYSRSRPHQLYSWPEDQKLLATASEGGSEKKILKRKLEKWETVIRQRKGNKSHFYVELIVQMQSAEEILSLSVEAKWRFFSAI